MVRARHSADAFTAIAEPRRRELLGVLSRENAGDTERDVSWLVNALGWPQPQVSKHLGVLRKAGLVSVERRGKHRLYTLNAENLRPVHEWIKTYERFWQHQLQRIKTTAELNQATSTRPKRPSTP
ncbi:MAG: ArsR/SmtB family transcription factor [Phycisphaerales bacterium]